jgi:hypothetical protein
MKRFRPETLMMPNLPGRWAYGLGSKHFRWTCITATNYGLPLRGTGIVGFLNRLLYLLSVTAEDVAVGFLPYLFSVATSFSAEAGAGAGTAFSSTMLLALNFLP